MMIRTAHKALVVVALSMVAVASAWARGDAGPGGSGSSDDGLPSERASTPPVIPRAVFGPGGRRIESGLRVERNGTGIFVADRVFPPGGEVEGMALPPHLGGGFLFFQPLAADGESATALFRAETWTGPLSPLARVPFPVRHVEAGLDRLYVLGVTLQVALDARTGEPLPLDPLPPLPTIEGLAFDGPRRALVSGPLVGVLYTEDGGLSWDRVEEAEEVQVNLNGSELLVRTSRGIEVVSEGGKLTTGRGSSSAAVPLDRFLSGHRSRPTARHRLVGGNESGVGPLPTVLDLERAWMALVTRGALDGDEPVAIIDRKLVRLASKKDLDLTVQSVDVPLDAECLGVEGERKKDQKSGAPLFLCQGESTSILTWGNRADDASRIEPPAPVWASSEPRVALSWGPGAILLEGACEPGSRGRLGEGCLVTRSAARDVSWVQGDADQVSFAIDSEQAWAIAVDEKDETVRATRLLSTSTGTKIRTWSIPDDQAVAEFLLQGTALRRAYLIHGEIGLWLARQEKLVGVRLGEGKKPSFGAIQRPLKRAVIDGPRAVIWGAAGFAKQSVDGGLSFKEIELPHRSGDPELSVVRSPTADVKMGCSEVGCALGRLLRLGWDVPERAAVAIPPATPFPRGTTSRFRFTCGAGDLDSPPRARVGESSFPSFWDQPAPRLDAGMSGTSIDFSSALAQLYAWGPSETNWSRNGRALVRFIDPWDPGKIRESAQTRQLFDSLLDAQTKMGHMERATSTAISTLDLGGQAGVLLLRDRSSTHLFSFFEGKPIESFAGAHDLGLRALVGAVLSHGSMVAAFRQGSELSIVRLVSGEIQHLANLPLGDSGDRGVELVRTASGDLGIAMDGDAGLFVYPLSDRGVLGTPIVVDVQRARPEACAPEASGYIVGRELAVAPYLESPEGGLLTVTRLQARYIVGYGAPCLEAMLGYSRKLESVSRMPRGDSGVPLSILNTDSTGRRLRLWCE